MLEGCVSQAVQQLLFTAEFGRLRGDVAQVGKFGRHCSAMLERISSAFGAIDGVVPWGSSFSQGLESKPVPNGSVLHLCCLRTFQLPSESA